MAGRKKNPNPSRKVDPMIPAESYACLRFLAEKLNRYGSNPNEVARYLILREIDELTRSGVIPKDLPE